MSGKRAEREVREFQAGVPWAQCGAQSLKPWDNDPS